MLVEVIFSTVSYKAHLLMVEADPHVVLLDRDVGDQAEGEHLHPAVVSNKGFRNCAHA